MPFFLSLLLLLLSVLNDGQFRDDVEHDDEDDDTDVLSFRFVFELVVDVEFDDDSDVVLSMSCSELFISCRLDKCSVS